MEFYVIPFFLAIFYLNLEFSHGFHISLKPKFPKFGHGKDGLTTEAPKPTPMPIFARFKDMNQLSKDMMHHDIVGLGIDGTAILETFKLNWPLKLLVKLINKLCSTIHPVYLKVFPGVKGKNETLLDSVLSMAQHGPKMLGGAMKMMSFMNEIKSVG